MSDIMRGNFDPNSGLASPAEDNKVYAKFYMRSMVDGEATNREKRTIKKDVPHVLIIQPGESRLSQYDQPATDADIQRFPRQWQAFQTGQTQEVSGSPLSLLFPESPAIVDNLKACGVHTVDQLAALNDSGIQNIGMGGRQWHEKAKAYLAAADKGKGFHELAAQVETMRLQREADSQKIAALESALAAATEKRGPGRPRNPETAAA